MSMPVDRPEDIQRLAAIRNDLPATLATHYLNCGTAGPLPRPVVEAIREQIDEELLAGRIGPKVFENVLARRDELRAALAERLHCDSAEIAITQSTTYGLNVALWGLNLQPGDEIVTTRHEHPGLLVPLSALARERSISVRYADWPADRPDLAMEAFAQCLSPRTRILAFSHVLWTTGAVLDVRAIAQLAHEAGALVIVDGAQSAGAIALDLSELGADFYSMPGQKWLLGPEGTGALFASRDAQALCSPTFTGGLSSAGVDALAPYHLPAPGARRYEVGPGLPAAEIGLLHALRWASEMAGEWALSRIGALSRELRDALAAIPSVELLTPKQSEPSGLVSFRVNGLTAPEAAQRLQAEGFLVRYLPDPHPGVRVSTGFYLLREEIAQLCDAIGHLTQN